MTAALEASGLSKRYGDRVALRDVDLVVKPGEIHGLLGPNGAGKSTLLRIVLGLVLPDAGTLHLLGMGQHARGDALPPRVAGFVDSPAFYPYLSARENLRILALLDEPDHGSRRDARVAEALRRVALEDQATVKVGAYSTGMRQRLGLAAALLRSPSLLVLDEPTSSLDPDGARELCATLRQLASDGAAILVSSHDLIEVEELCSTLTILRRGRVVWGGPVPELRVRAGDAGRTMRTSDDVRARSLSEAHAGLEVEVLPGEGEGLSLHGDAVDVDRYVVALGHAGIAVRNLERPVRSLESSFLSLTAEPTTVPPSDSIEEPEPRAARVRDSSARPIHLAGLWAVVAVECAKLRAEVKAWCVLALCFAAPFGFGVAMRVQTTLPEDTLFGRGVTRSGFALSLVVLGFSVSWAVPALTSVVGGDVFSAEDRHGTWSTLRTRSRSSRELFAGKVATAILFSCLSVSLLGVSSVAAGALLIGRQPLVGLSGTLLPAGHTAMLVLAAWLSVLPAALGFTGLAVLVSVATRSSAAGVGVPVLVALAMGIGSLVDGPDTLRGALLTTPLTAWHGLFAAPPYYRPLLEGACISALYVATLHGAAYAVARRRERTG